MKSILVIIISLLSLGASSQTLFTYGSHKVSSDEFIRAFRKNNEAGKVNETDVRNYLDLYTRFRLKVQDAYDMKLDTLINKQEDVVNFRKQIEDQFMIDTELKQQLIKEAKQRGTKEIRVSHIFIPFKEEFIANGFVQLDITAADSQRTVTKINEAYNKLLAGEEFGKVAAAYSLDPEVKNNKGDLGYITVFSLPYVLETAAYNLPLNGVSKPFASDKGYHIIKKTEERDARGRMQVQQILIANDAEGGASSKQSGARLADSLYKAIKNGASFDELAKTYSLDMGSAPSGGLLPPIQVGEYNVEFEKKVFGLTKDGEVIPPFETESGFHIIKRVQLLK
jgi:peptidyl-prolyl cis-trans isomerase SurA